MALARQPIGALRDDTDLRRSSRLAYQETIESAAQGRRAAGRCAGEIVETHAFSARNEGLDGARSRSGKPAEVPGAQRQGSPKLGRQFVSRAAAQMMYAMLKALVMGRRGVT